MKQINNILNNKFIKILFAIIKAIIWLLVIAIVLLIAIQRLFNNEVSLGSYRMFTVATGSMQPEYKIYDVIISKEKPLSQIKIGDDLVYLGKERDYKGKIITHRVIDLEKKDGKYYFETKGIANEVADPIVEGSQVYGVVTYRPQILSLLSHILNNSYGLYFLIIVPLAFLILLEILDRIKDKETENEREN